MEWQPPGPRGDTGRDKDTSWWQRGQGVVALVVTMGTRTGPREVTPGGQGQVPVAPSDNEDNGDKEVTLRGQGQLGGTEVTPR